MAQMTNLILTEIRMTEEQRTRMTVSGEATFGSAQCSRLAAEARGKGQDDRYFLGGEKALQDFAAWVRRREYGAGEAIAPWHCAKCGRPMQFADGMCWSCFGGDPGQ
jgi:hypothetical protein